MGGSKSRDKGKRGEREVATLLREWLGDEYDVRRLRAVDQADVGDLVIEPPIPVAIEIKLHAAFNALHLWTGAGGFTDWFAQCERQAIGAGKAPLLIFRGDRMPWFAAMKQSDWLAMGPRITPYMVVHPEGDFPAIAIFPLSALLSRPASVLAELGG